jgi:AraC-like DNA-binding protein
MLFLFGPLFFFYAKSVIDHAFHWQSKYWLHFIPYGVQLLVNMPLLVADRTFWTEFVGRYLSGELPIRQIEKMSFVFQDIHLFIYLGITFKWIQSAKERNGNAQYILPLSSRVKWLTALACCLVLFLGAVIALHSFIFIHGTYDPSTNYAYTLISSAIIYFIAYNLVLTPGLINPDFARKYRGYMQFAGEDEERYLQNLRSLMSEKKFFTNPDLNLPMLAVQLGLPSHQVSKLINEKLGKSFSDFINEYRVKEFINRMNDTRYQSLSIYGVALDVGFNSKSSFNAAFKKITGKTPKDYKTAS